MDYNNGQPYQNTPPSGPPQGPYRIAPSQGFAGPKRQPANSLAAASMVLGIASIVLTCTIYLAPVLGGVAVILALLSRGSGKKLHGCAVAGIITAAIAIVLDLCIIAVSFTLVFTNPDMKREFWRSYKEMGEELYGDQFDDILKEVFGEDFDIDEQIGDAPESGGYDTYQEGGFHTLPPEESYDPKLYEDDGFFIGLTAETAPPSRPERTGRNLYKRSFIPKRFTCRNGGKYESTKIIG